MVDADWVVTNEEKFKERMADWLVRVGKVVEERERLHPGELERINKQLGLDKEQNEENRMMGALRDGKFSDHHIKIILGQGDDTFDQNNPIYNKSRIFAHEYNPITRPWMFVATRSGSGKTTAVHGMIWDMLKSKKIVSPGYIVHTDFIEACFSRGKDKAKVEDLYKYDMLVIDDFFKKAFEGGSVREQDIIKKLIDYFYRFRKGLVICADVSIDIIHDQLDKDEYADQICYRVLEKCGYKKDRRFVYGFNDLPNLRKNKEE